MDKLKLLLATLLAAGIAGANGQGVTINGAQNVSVGESHSYNAVLSEALNLRAVQTIWAPQGGQVLGSSMYNASIQWITALPANSVTCAVEDIYGDYYAGSRSVTVAMPTPNTEGEVMQPCYSTTLTRNTNPEPAYNWYWQTSSSGTSTTLGSGASITVTQNTSLYLRARTVGTPYRWSSALFMGDVVVVNKPSAPATTAVTHRFGEGPVTLTAGASSGAIYYRWYTTSAGGTPLPVYSNTYTVTVSGTAEYYVAGTIADCESDRTSVSAYVHPILVLTATNNAVVSLGRPVMLSANTGYDTYRWEDGAGQVISNTRTVSVNKKGLYKAHITRMGAATSGTINVSTGQEGQNKNYVVTNTVQRKFVLNDNEIDTLGPRSNQQVTQYFDGLGRLRQTVTTQGSPSKKDVIQPVVYDALGREHRAYLPVTHGSDGWYKQVIDPATSAYAGAVAQFYNNPADNIADDARPFSETTFEQSPLGKPLQQYGPGADWITNQKAVRKNQLTLVEGTGASEENIIIWTLNETTQLPERYAGINSGVYATGDLAIAETLDEHGHAVREYTDKRGKVILKKVQVLNNATDLNNASQWAFTYYVYDDRAQLRYVFQPELSKRIHQTAGYNPVIADLDALAFQYRYDGRARMIEKKVPGAGHVYMVYDNRDRLVLTQDGKQRAANKWTFTKYDVLNRPIITGIYTHGSNVTQADMSGLVSTVNFYETYDSNQPHLYSNNVFPQLSASTDVHTVTYYDNYAFAATLGADFSYKPAQLGAQVVNGVTYSQPETAHAMVIGQVTGTKIKNLGDGLWLRTVTYYDDKYRAIQTTTDHQFKGTDRTTSLYDFVGKVLATKTEHVAASLVWKDLVNVTQSGGELKKAAIPYGANAGAASVQVLPAGQDGWVEMVYPGSGATGSEQFFGLNDTNPDVDGANINYAFLITANNVPGNVRVYENGVLRQGLPGVKAKGDVLRIERVGTQVTYKVNGFPEYLSQVASTTSLMADVTILQSMGYTYGTRASFSQRSQSVTRRFEYDHAGRLLNTWHSVNGQPEVQLAKNAYNELGQLITKSLHGTGGNTFKQHTDYRYNIRGWLTTINDPTTPQAGDLFNMSLHYNDPTAKGGAAQYNGNISETIWSSAGLDKQSYGYSYDNLNRLTEAKYHNNVTSAEDGRYNEKIGDDDPLRPGYDLNGNILNLFRHGKKTATGFGLMDDLGYTYANGGNQLTAVSDGIGTQPAENGFKEVVEGTLDYTYDANGNMNKDVNKGITSIEYNHLNLPSKVSKSTTEYITYAYDATGRKLTQQVFGTTAKRTDYVGEMIYENDTLKFINHEEGRVVMTGSVPEYQYHLKDHLGNVRLTFTTKREAESKVATLEAAQAASEQGEFLRYANARKVLSALLDHTNGAATGYAQRLNGTANEKYGLAKSLSVMPGDTVKMEVFAKYLDTNTANWSQVLTNLATAIANNTGGIVVDGSNYGSSTSSFPYPGLLNTSSNTGTAPKAYLNWIIFDRGYNFIDGGFKPMSTAGREYGQDAAHELLSATVAIKEPGYVYIYFSNENETPVEVFFDDFKVEHVQGPVVQMDDYYPFGGDFNSYARENSILNQYKFNGASELQNELDLEVYLTDYRAYDQWGRLGWWQVDPKADELYSFSPYNYSLNNPILHNDPKGDCPPIICGAIAGAVIGGVAGGIIAALDGQDMEGILTSAAGGAVSGAIIGSGVGLLAGTAATGSLAGVVATNAATGFVGGAAESITEQSISVATGRQNNFNTADVVKSAAVGAVANVLAGPAANVVSSKISNSVVKTTTQQVASITSKETQKVLRKEVAKASPMLTSRQVNKEVNKLTRQKVTAATAAGKTKSAAGQTAAELGIETVTEKTTEETKSALRRQ